jgi:hypothetical protein
MSASRAAIASRWDATWRRSAATEDSASLVSSDSRSSTAKQQQQQQHLAQTGTKFESEQGATRTANEFNLLYFALIRLPFHVLSAFREPVHLRGMRLPTLVDLCDGARVEIGDGL